MPDSVGYRTKFAAAVPSTNTAVPPEFDAMPPHGVISHTERIVIPTTRSETTRILSD